MEILTIRDALAITIGLIGGSLFLGLLVAYYIDKLARKEEDRLWKD